MDDFTSSLQYPEVVAMIEGRSGIKQKLLEALTKALTMIDQKTISSDEIAELILHLRKYAVMHLESSTDLTMRINRIKAKERLKYERMLECKNTK